MNSQILHESWRIVLVVTPWNAHQLRQTLEDVQSKSLSSRITIITTDSPAVRSALAGLSLPVDYKLPLSIEEGSYWTTLISTYEFAADRTIFLQAGTRVPEHWDARLIAAGQRARDAVAISPQCVRHPIFSAFTSSDYKPELSVDEIDQWLNDYVEGVEYSVPVVLESCALLQGNGWRIRNRQIDNDRQLFEDIRAKGACILATDQLYVNDFKVIYYNEIDFLPKAYIDAYLLRPPLARVRHALTELSRRQEKPSHLRCCLPVQLHVGHSWGGGLGRWMEDFIAADANHHHLVLRSIGDLSGYGQTIALYRSSAMDVPIESWTLCEPIMSINLVSIEYRRIIEKLVDYYCVESIVVSSLVGHSLDILNTTLPTIVVLHDYFPFCPALYATFGSPCHSCNEGQLRLCSQNNPRYVYFKFETTDHWLAVRHGFVQALLRESISIITPSQSVVDRYRQLESGLTLKKIHVVAHGLDESLAQSLQASSKLPRSVSTGNGRLSIVMLGRLTDEKGADLLAGIFERISRFADVYLLGTGESGARFESMPGVSIQETYRKEELGDLLCKINPDIGMLLSIVPETFSYTLSELWAAGIPVLATRLGAFADRITDSANGWLVEPDSKAVLEKLHLLNCNRQLLKQSKAFVVRQEVRTASQMVTDYSVLTPHTGSIPLVRYHLPRRSYLNPYSQGFSEVGGGAIYVNHQQAYRQVLAEFLLYTSRKLEQSPRLPQWNRAFLSRLIRKVVRYLDSNQAGNSNG